MKVIIDIPKKDYDKMCKGELINTILAAIKNGTPIPDNATNGDMIRTMFSNAQFKQGEEWTISQFFMKMNMTDVGFASLHKDWWNAPYNYNKEVEE